MAIERKPKNPVPKGNVPPGGIRYQVKDGDSWGSVARMHGVSDPWSLIEYNFDTRSPAEVNWYLREYVGCLKETSDGKNWIFSGDAQPGVIYLPPSRSSGPVGDGEHVVQEGETVFSVAYLYGHVWQTLWHDSQNEAVKRARKDPGEVLPGDRLHIPEINPKWVDRKTETRHHVRRLGVPYELGVLEVYTDLSPGEVANIEDAFTLTGAGGVKSYKGTRSVKDDTVEGDNGITLLFTGLPTDASYTLSVVLEGGDKVDLFKDVPFLDLHQESERLNRKVTHPR